MSNDHSGSGHYIEVDDDITGTSEYDSLYGAESASATTSLIDSVKAYKYENGRRYHAYKEGQWLVPNDEVQQDQMDLFHHVFLLRLRGKLFLAPIETPQKILDVGTGTGIWAIQIAEEFPDAEVVGNDISPIQPSWVPPKVSFEVDDFNDPWLQAPNSYDFIHERDCHAAVKDWGKFAENVFKTLKPGGYWESQEHTVEITADDGSVPEDNILKQWCTNLIQATEIIGQTCVVAPHIIGHMQKAGFVNIKQQFFKLPIGAWPKDPVDKEIGAFNLINMVNAAEGFTTAAYTRILGKSIEEAAQAVVDIKRDLQNKDFHMYFQFAVTYGQKPLDSPTE
ncbi:hypothetical protein TWF191_000134 [Orbilia oligospora]|uniref:Methyltransferase domain-containing protein n=1 Tax=Orbilia oligospora TaxID=2813651 RepID=A0A7C8V1Z8_ORBOL|nr:hypothetical protein TWF191_000134 [Orbilia oligospora]